jgi:hypothetical protein
MELTRHILREKRLEHFDNNSNNHDEISCPICYDNVNINEAIGKCCGDHGQKHYFHTRCLMQWMESGVNRKCPICRGNVQINQTRVRQTLYNNTESNDIITWLNNNFIINNINNNDEWINLNSFEKTGVVVGFISSMYVGLKIGEETIKHNNEATTYATLEGARYVYNSENISFYNKLAYGLGYVSALITSNDNNDDNDDNNDNDENNNNE